MTVSIIIPAYNAAKTIQETLDSVVAQTHVDWEAIVVDDGSDDETRQVVREFCQNEPRIRLVLQEHAGVSAARNRGVAEATGDWLLFLDADDLILENHLERLLARLADDPHLDAVVGGWARLAPSGELIEAPQSSLPEEPFQGLAQYCLFPIHACLVRRALVVAVGGWDPSFTTCEDWDLWLRVARSGARFGAISDLTALYRTNVGSASLNGQQLLRDGLRVLALASTTDPRVPNPDPRYQAGLSGVDLTPQHYYFMMWCAGLELGRGEEASSLLSQLSECRCQELDFSRVVANLFWALPLAVGAKIDDWPAFLAQRQEAIDRFLQAVEKQTLIAGFCGEVSRLLEQRILMQLVGDRPAVVGKTMALSVNAERPLRDIEVPAEAERAICEVYIGDERLGAVELPVFDGLLSAYVMRDAIASEFAWQILERYFRETLYPRLEASVDNGRLSIWRGQLCLLQDLAAGEDWTEPLFQQAGWTLFLQEVWGCPDWSLERFYDPQELQASGGDSIPGRNGMTLEISEPLPTLLSNAPHVEIVVTVGGTPIGLVQLAPENGAIGPQKLRAAITRATGFELCRAAVREAILGSPLAAAGSLRERLTQIAGKNKQAPDSPVAEAERRTGPSTLVLGRLSPQAIDTPQARRAALPANAYGELIAASELFAQPVATSGSPDEPPRRIFYAPDLCSPVTHSADPTPDRAALLESGSSLQARPYGRSHFERIFAGRSDPWIYEHSDYERIKYEQTLQLLPPGPIRRALEVGCAEGHFTERLAPRVGTLLAADISELALERAAARCSGLDNIEFGQLDIVKDGLPGQFDLIVCSELLYYVGGIEQLEQVAEKLAAGLARGGYLLMAHANLVSDDADQTGFDWGLPFGARTIGETFAALKDLQLVREVRTPLYRVQLFRRSSGLRRVLPQRVQLIEYDEVVALPDGPVVDTIRWNGAFAHTHDQPQAETAWLPILMYHRISPQSPAGYRRYTVTPEAFDKQMQYLRDAGFYGINLQTWQMAMAEHRPLPGRAVLITFDDAYTDFMEHAWPLLQRHGFPATLFVVAEETGGRNRWDRFLDEPLPLLSWEDLRRLRTEGLEIGSHSATHRRLTGISPSQVVREAIRSRIILKQKLGESTPALAYPYGSSNGLVHHLVGACGYTFGLTCQGRRAGLWDSLLALPRIEIRGDEDFADFVLKLEGE